VVFRVADGAGSLAKPSGGLIPGRLEGIAGNPASKWRVDELEGARFGRSARRGPGQGALGPRAASQSNDATNLDRSTAEPQLLGMAPLPRVRRTSPSSNPQQAGDSFFAFAEPKQAVENQSVLGLILER